MENKPKRLGRLIAILAGSILALVMFTGCYVHHPHPGPLAGHHWHHKRWVPGHFNHHGVWIPGHWRR